MEDIELGRFHKIKEREFEAVVYNMLCEKIADLEKTITEAKSMGPIGNFEQV